MDTQGVCTLCVREVTGGFCALSGGPVLGPLPQNVNFCFTFTFTFSMGLHGQSPSLTSRDRLERAHMSRRSLAVGAHTQSQSHPGTHMRGPTRWSPARPRLVCTFTPPSPHSLPPLRGRLRVLSVPLCVPTSCRVGVFPSLPFTSPRTVSPSSPGVRRRGGGLPPRSLFLELLPILLSRDGFPAL